MSFLRALEYDSELYSTTYDEITFQYRLLSIREYNYFNKVIKGGAMPPIFIYEEIFKLCSINAVEYYPKDVAYGYVITTGNLIYELSGGKELKDFLLDVANERKAAPADSILEHMKSIIYTAFSSLSPKDIDNLTEKQFIKYFVQAENKLVKTINGFQRIDLKSIYEEVYEKKNDKQAEQKSEVVHNVNRMEQELGYWEVKEAEERFIAEEKARLTREHLAKLDQRQG
jgi:hypothetical protein